MFEFSQCSIEKSSLPMTVAVAYCCASQGLFAMLMEAPILNELSKLLIGLLVLDGHAACIGTAQAATCRSAGEAPCPGSSVHRGRRLADALEWLMLVPVWVGTLLMVVLAAAEVVQHA